MSSTPEPSAPPAPPKSTLRALTLSARPIVRRPLRVTIGAVALLAALVPLVLAALVLTDVNADAVRDSSRTLHTAVAQDIARTVDATFDDARGDLRAVAQALTDRDLAGPDRVRAAVALVTKSRALDGIGVYAKDGVRIDAIEARPGLPLPDKLDDALLARLTVDFVAGEVVRKDGAPPRLFVVSPIVIDGVRTGAVAGYVSLAALQARVERLSAVTLPGYPHAIFVVDPQRRFVAHTTAARALALDDASAEPLVSGLNLATDRPSEAQFITEAQSARPRDGAPGETEDVVGATISLAGAGAGFVVGVQMPTSVVYASLTHMRRAAASAVGLAVLLALAGAFLVARTITGPIEQLVVRADELAARRFAAVTPLPPRPDELGVLGQAIVGAARALDESEAALLQETRLREGLGRYLPAQLVDAYVNEEHASLLEGKRAEITVLFADVVGFTPLSSKLPPEQLCALLNDLFTIMTEIVFKHGGTVDKFIGDSVMAFWGAPIADRNHAEHAVEAARDMLRFLDVGNARWKKKFGVEVRLAIGMNTGTAAVGNLGSEKRLVYTAIGESVNIAARLESVAGPQQILATRATIEAAALGKDAVAVGPQALAGLDHPVDVFAVEV